MLLSQGRPLCGSISQRKKNCCHGAFCLTLHLRNEGESYIHSSTLGNAQGWARLSQGGLVALALPLKGDGIGHPVLFTLLSKGPLSETSSFLNTVSPALTSLTKGIIWIFQSVDCDLLKKTSCQHPILVSGFEGVPSRFPSDGELQPS